MADVSKGRTIVLTCFFFILALTIGLAVVGGGGSSPAVVYGRPVLVALSCLLVWQGRLWARLLLVLLGFGVILAGPIAMGNGIGPFSTAGLVAWASSALYIACILVLYLSKEARAFFATLATTAPTPAGSPPRDAEST